MLTNIGGDLLELDKKKGPASRKRHEGSSGEEVNNATLIVVPNYALKAQCETCWISYLRSC